MNKRMLSLRVFLVLMMAAILWPASLAGADDPDPGTPPPVYKDKITIDDKEAAAANLKAAKARTAGTIPEPATIIDPDTGKMVPDYFGVANWAYSPPLTKFVDALPGLYIPGVTPLNPDGSPTSSNALGQYIPVAVADTTTYASTNSDYYEIALVEWEEQLHSELPPTRLREYVQLETPAVLAKLAALEPPVVSKHVPVGDPADGLFAVDDPHYLGPAIVGKGSLPGQANTPVRIKFYNLLPKGPADPVTGRRPGDLFIPVDTTVMGAGMGPDGMTEYTQNRATVHLHGNNSVWISDGTPHQWITPANEDTPYPQGVSVEPVPDMGDTGAPADGTMTFFYSNAQSSRLMFYHDHAMGITRLNVYAGEAAAYVLTDDVETDLIAGTNVTGVNPGLLQVLPDIGIPLVIQDRTFVDPATIATTDPTWVDPLQGTFGTTPGTAHAGDLWYPHVYVPAQNPWAPDGTGTNPYGRWMYGPWFYPPTTNIDVGPVPNPYSLPYPPGTVPGHLGDLNYWDNSDAPWEPPFMPGTPNPSMPGEAFMDTPLVNGTAFPYLEVEPKDYRFRILNAANDRFLNLSLYQANPGIVGNLTATAGSGYTADPVVTVANAATDTTGHGFTLSATADLTPGSPTLGQVTFAIRSVGSNYTLPPVITVTRAAGDTTGAGATATAVLHTAPTEVGMVPVSTTNWLPPFDASGVPDQTMAGPDWIQIGTEGGFLPAPAVIPAQPITWNTNPTTFNFGTVKGHSLLLGTAERADVVVDFSDYAGQTLILYNDAPAAFPAPVPTYDYYTNNQDLTDVGGAPTTPPGVGPNTRTIMQIRVTKPLTTGTPDVTLANLESVWAKGTGASTKRGVFEVSQDPIIIPHIAYNSAYGKTGVGADTFTSAAADALIQVNLYSKTFRPIDAAGTIQAPVNIPIQPKGAHDEMGGVYSTRDGRMSGMLGLELPATTSQIAQFLPYGYASPPVDIMAGSVAGTMIGSLDDGTQIWNITHNGVDTHTIHTHLFNAQIINRVGWDGILLPPDPNELGWKETFRMNPLEQIFLALRPTLPTTAQVPFLDQVPNSVRLIDPTMPEGAVLTPPPPVGWFDPNGVRINSILNHEVNFGWEYVYHCHILAHEEMDMMHTMAFAVPPTTPTNLSATLNGANVTLNWTDNSLNETRFTIQRADTPDFATGLVSWTVDADVATYTDTTIQSQTYYYRVFASNTVGDSATTGFQTTTVKSAVSNTAQYPLSGPVGPLDHITVLPASASIPVAGTQTFTAFGYDAVGNLREGDTFTWSVTDANAGTILPGTGVFTAGNIAGTYSGVVQATSGAVTGTASVTVTPGPLHHVQVAPGIANVQAGGAQTFTATGYDAGNNQRTGDIFTWSVTNPTAGSINATSGAFTAGSVAGTYVNVVQASSGGIAGHATVNVTLGLHHIVVTPASDSVPAQGHLTFTARGFDANNTPRTGDIFTWSVSDAAAGSINPTTGVFTAGTVSGVYTNVVQATSGAIVGTATVTVIDAPLSLLPAVNIADVGYDFTVTINTNVPDGTPIVSVDAFIDFDPAYLEVVDADAITSGTQIAPGSHLTSVLANSVDNALGQISFSAGALGTPPTGGFLVATITFRGKAATPAGSPTPIAVSLANRRQSAATNGGVLVLGAHSDSAAQINPVTTINGEVTLQGGSRPAAARVIPLTVKLFPAGGDVQTYAIPLGGPQAQSSVKQQATVPIAVFTTNTVDTGSNNVTFQVTVPQGAYDILVIGPHTLPSVRQNVVVSGVSINLSFGILLEGNCNGDGQVTALDFSILASSYLKSTGQAGFDPRADFDGTGQVNSLDFSMLAMNYLKVHQVITGP